VFAARRGRGEGEGEGEGVVPEWERVRWGKQLGRRGVGVGREREWALAPRQLEGEGKKRVRGYGSRH